MLSRVADSLYWMSRYLERAENTVRQLDVTMNLPALRLAGSNSSQRWEIRTDLNGTATSKRWPASSFSTL